MTYFKLIFIVTIFMAAGCASKNLNFTASTNKEEALTLAKKIRGTCKINESGIGDGMENGPIYPFSRWTIKLHQHAESFYQPKLYLDDNRKDIPGKYCSPYYISGDQSLIVGSLMGLGVMYEKEIKEK